MNTRETAHQPVSTPSRAPLVRRLTFWAFVAFIAAYVGILSGAMFVFQFGFNELPCPLCIAQRMAMMTTTLGPLLIVVNALRGTLTRGRFLSGLGMSVLGALLGAAMSTRQILLHIAPGDPGYGQPVLGLHLYTWAFITFVVVVLFVGVVLLFGDTLEPVAPASRAAHTITWLVVWAFVVTIALNMIVVFFELGFNLYLPDDPTRYELLYQLGLVR